MLAVGVNAWAVMALVPSLLAAKPNMAALAATCCPLLVLGLGTGLLRRSPRLARWLLFAGFPPALAGATIATGHWAIREPYPPLGVVLGVASFMAYLGVTAWALGRPSELRWSAARPLGRVDSEEPPKPRRQLQRLLVGLGTVGAVTLALGAPFVGGRDQLQRQWGEAAPEAATMTTVVAAALATAVLAVFVAPATRRARTRDPSPRQVAVRVTLLLVMVLAGVFTWTLVQRG